MGPKIFRRSKQAHGIYLGSRNRPYNPTDPEQEQQDCFLLSSREVKDPYSEAGIPELVNEMALEDTSFRRKAMYLNTEAKEPGKGVLTGLQKLLWLVCRTRGCCLLMPCQESRLTRGHKSLQVFWVSPLPGPRFAGTLLLLVGRISVDNVV